MYELSRRLSLAYWPRPELNESADRARGDAEVDKMSIGELAQYFSEVQIGPTYCMVARRVGELLKQFPPHIEDRKNRAVAALAAARTALFALSQIIPDGVV